MFRFILISFFFLGWGFYVLSGGSEFEPEPPKRLERFAKNAEAARSIEENVTVETADTAPAAVAEVQPESPVATLPTTVANRKITNQIQTVSQQVEPATNAVLASHTILSNPFKNDSEDAVFTLSGSDNTAAEATILDGSATLAGLTQPEPPKDLRKVRATRVNMRNGPGTQYDVLASLANGQEVLVLKDPGSGWVKLRVVESNRVGWVSSRLLEKSP